MQKRSDGELAANTFAKLLHYAVAVGLVGGAVRSGQSLMRNTNPRYEAPDVPKPVIIDMPYPVPGAPPVTAIPAAGKEKKVQEPAAKRAAFDGPYPEWTSKIPFARELYSVLPRFTAPAGPEGATSPNQVPLTGLLTLPAMMAGGYGGYRVADRVLRAADRWRARKELDEAKADYQTAMSRKLVDSTLPGKSAATDAPAPGVERAKRAVDALYACAKRAEDAPGPAGSLGRLLVSLGMPGHLFGPDAALANWTVAGGMGTLGGYLGYQHFRDPAAAAANRKAVKRIDRENAEGLPPPLLARLVPTPVRS